MNQQNEDHCVYLEHVVLEYFISEVYNHWFFLQQAQRYRYIGRFIFFLNGYKVIQWSVPQLFHCKINLISKQGCENISKFHIHLFPFMVHIPWAGIKVKFCLHWHVSGVHRTLVCVFCLCIISYVSNTCKWFRFRARVLVKMAVNMKT